MENSYKEDYKIKYSDADRNLKLGVLNTAYKIQNMGTELFTKLDSSNIDVKNRYNAAWVLAKFKMHFIKYPEWSDNVKIESFISKVSKIATHTDIKFKDENDNDLIVAKQESCLIDLGDRKLKKLEDIDFTKNVDVKDTIYDTKFDRMNTQFSDEDLIKKIEVHSIDTDYSKHTNNVSYIKFVMSLFDSNFMDNNIITDFEINYKNESLEGQKLDVYEKKSDENAIDFMFKNDDKEVIRARVKYNNK